VNGVYNGITYSGAEYVADVTLSTADDGVGGMIVSKPAFTQNGQTVAQPVFENSYAVSGTAEFSLTGTKLLTGGMPLADELFIFDLYEGDALLATASNKDGQFTFRNVKLTTLGEHTLTVTERKGDLSGITYSDLVYTVKVNVVDQGDGTMAAQAPVITLNGQTAETVTFENVFTPDNITVRLDVTKTVQNLTNAELSPEGFQFNLEQDGKVLKTVTADAQGKAFFEITFTPESLTTGTFRFQVRELNTGKIGVTYSEKIYNVTVVISQDETGQLVANILVDDQVATEPVLNFVNVYDPPATPSTGDSSNPGLYIALFGISGLGMAILLAIYFIDRKRRSTKAE